MNFVEVVLSLLAGIGGISGFIVIGVKFSSNIIAKNLQEKYSLKLNKELEEYKAKLENKNYISKAKFDLEIAAYHELSEIFCKAIKEVSALIPPGFTYWPADKEERKKYENEIYKSMIEKLNMAQDTLNKNSFLIREEFCRKYNQILKLCESQYHAYERRKDINYPENSKKYNFTQDEYNRTLQIQKIYDDLTNDIRNYLNNLIVEK